MLPLSEHLISPYCVAPGFGHVLSNYWWMYVMLHPVTLTLKYTCWWSCISIFLLIFKTTDNISFFSPSQSKFPFSVTRAFILINSHVIFVLYIYYQIVSIHWIILKTDQYKSFRFYVIHFNPWKSLKSFCTCSLLFKWTYHILFNYILPLLYNNYSIHCRHIKVNKTWS